MSAPVIHLDAAEAIELAEILEFIREWFDRDYSTLRARLARFTGDGIGLDDLRGDLRRFAELIVAAPIYSDAAS